MPARRAIPEGIRITKVGLWYVLFAVVVGVAATNTGNNALYLVLALMLGVLVVSGVASRLNLRDLELALEPPGEVHANRPFLLRFVVRNRSRLLPRWLLVMFVARDGTPMLVPYLPAGVSSRGGVELMLRKRGFHRIGFAHLASLFPLGFFRKGMRYRTDLEVLVFPELFAAGAPWGPDAGMQGDAAAARIGWGHDLRSFRAFRSGDDPRGIHWKQTARTGSLIYMERESEEGRRISIVFDNGVSAAPDTEELRRFERLVSEAATAACDYLGRGFEVELMTRDHLVGYGSGYRQRLRILEQLALIEPRPGGTAERLAGSDPKAPELRLGLGGGPGAGLGGPQPAGEPA